jgi:flagellar secretion chaperone FliS
MFSANSAAAYAKVGVETKVSSADPHQLILMLFDGALLAVNSASASIANKDIQAKIRHITKAIEIISLGLAGSLDPHSSPELYARLASLYEYMCTRLVVANAENNDAPLVEVAHLLQELREAWAQIGNTPRSQQTLAQTEEA